MLAENIFFRLRWTEVTTKSFISLPPWFSVILFTLCFDFLASLPIVPPDALLFWKQFHTIFLSKSFLHFCPLTCQFSPTSYLKYSDLDLPLLGWLISPFAVPVPNFYFLSFLDLCHFSVTFSMTSSYLALNPPSLNLVRCPRCLNYIPFFELSEISVVCEVLCLCVFQKLSVGS